MLKVQLLGSFQVTHDGEPIAGLTKPRMQSLLAYLLLHRRTPQSRNHLAYTFWPDSSESQARTNLRRELHELRRASPQLERCIRSPDSRSIQWHADELFSFDVDDFEEGVADVDRSRNMPTRRESLQRAIGIYQGDLVPDLYDDWILPKREELRQRFIQALRQLINLLAAERDYVSAAQLTQRLLRFDPLFEAGYRQLMELYAQQNDRASALHTYHTWTSVLERELGVPPSAEMQALYERLLKADAAMPSTPAVTATDARRLVGRNAEWQLLLAAWRRSSQGHAQFVLIEGEAGIGKTRLAEELLEWVTRQGVTCARTRSYAAEGSLAYAPIAEWLRTPAMRATWAALDDVWLTEVARLLPELLAEHSRLPSPKPLTDRLQHQRLFEALARAFTVDKQPKLLLIDDLQWCDQDTLDWLRYLLRFDPGSRLLVVGTARSEETQREHPLHALELALSSSEQLTNVALAPLTVDEATALANQTGGQELSTADAARLFADSEGNPFFLVEMVRAGYHEQASSHKGGPAAGRHLPASQTQLPAKVYTVIQSRLAQLSAIAYRLAGLAATIGRSFTLDVLLAACKDDEDVVARGLDELWRRRIIREQGAQGYDFSHDCIRNVAYAEIGPVQRHLFHRQVAEALEAVYGDALDAISGPLAVHYERADMVSNAAHYHQRAAAVARHIFANEDAVDHLSQAVRLLQSLPETAERHRRELSLQIELSAALQAARSMTASEVEAAYRRAEELARAVGEPPELFPARFGWWVFQFSISEQRAALKIGKELLASAQNSGNPDFILQAHHALWTSSFANGDFPAALAHCQHGKSIYRHETHHPQLYMYGSHDAGICCLSFAGPVQWLLGYPDQALDTAQKALDLSTKFTHPATLAQRLYWSAVLHQLRYDVPAVRTNAEAADRLSSKHTIPFWHGWETCLLGWADVMQGQPAAGIEQIHHGLADMQARRGQLLRPYFLTLLADAYERSSQLDLGLQTVEAAMTEAEETGERWWIAELHRQRGALLHRQGADDLSERSYLRAIEIARQQKAKSLELRATMALCRLWQHHGKKTQAHRVLSELYDWFTEGFETHDLRAARDVLQQLS